MARKAAKKKPQPSGNCGISPQEAFRLIGDAQDANARMAIMQKLIKAGKVEEGEGGILRTLDRQYLVAVERYKRLVGDVLSCDQGTTDKSLAEVADADAELESEEAPLADTAGRTIMESPDGPVRVINGGRGKEGNGGTVPEIEDEAILALTVESVPQKITPDLALRYFQAICEVDYKSITNWKVEKAKNREVVRAVMDSCMASGFIVDEPNEEDEGPHKAPAPDCEDETTINEIINAWQAALQITYIRRRKGKKGKKPAVVAKQDDKPVVKEESPKADAVQEQEEVSLENITPSEAITQLKATQTTKEVALIMARCRHTGFLKLDDKSHHIYNQECKDVSRNEAVKVMREFFEALERIRTNTKKGQPAAKDGSPDPKSSHPEKADKKPTDPLGITIDGKYFARPAKAIAHADTAGGNFRERYEQLLQIRVEEIRVRIAEVLPQIKSAIRFKSNNNTGLIEVTEPLRKDRIIIYDNKTNAYYTHSDLEGIQEVTELIRAANAARGRIIDIIEGRIERKKAAETKRANYEAIIASEGGFEQKFPGAQIAFRIEVVERKPTLAGLAMGLIKTISILAVESYGTIFDHNKIQVGSYDYNDKSLPGYVRRAANQCKPVSEKGMTPIPMEHEGIVSLGSELSAALQEDQNKSKGRKSKGRRRGKGKGNRPKIRSSRPDGRRKGGEKK